MRNKNIFIRKETAFSVVHGNGLPVFAHVTGYDPHIGYVIYEVNYPVAVKHSGTVWKYPSERIHPFDRVLEEGEEYIPEYLRPRGPTIYAKPLEDFLKLFDPDYYDEYSNYG